MSSYMKGTVLLIGFWLSFISCNSTKTNTGKIKAVEIKKENGKYTLYRNGKPFIIKGGAGYTHLKELHEIGGNTIRVWDTLQLTKVLDSAQANHLAVIVGIPLPLNDNMDIFYNNDVKVNASFKKITQTVNKFKNHPALLCWCLGNEIAFPWKPNFNRFYKAFNSIVDMIHRDDPDHPVTTTIMTFRRKNIANIKLRTNVDFISFNIFGSIHTLAKDLDDFKWLWNGPFLITEWGIEGPWRKDKQNAWAAKIEYNSTEKADQYLSIYQKFMPVNNPGFLGEMVFYWGQKQELTPTWFSMFDKNGTKTEAVNTMQYIWTGKQATYHAPAVKYMLINGKDGPDNIFLKPDSIAQAIVHLDKPEKGLTFKWQLIAEDWFSPNNIFSAKEPKTIEHAIVEINGTGIKFKAPNTEGPYRLLAFVYNKQGYVATCNTPFYVLANP